MITVKMTRKASNMASKMSAVLRETDVLFRDLSTRIPMDVIPYIAKQNVVTYMMRRRIDLVSSMAVIMIVGQLDYR